MPKSAPPSPTKARKSAEKSERFPSRALWQDPWEGVGDLKKLRAKKAWLDSISRLAERDPGAQQLPVVSEEALGDLVASLALESDKAKKLASDARLIARWHHLPEYRKRYRLGHVERLKLLTAALKAGERFYDVLAPDAFGFEGLLGELGLNDDDTLDLPRLADQAHRFTQLAKNALKLTKRRVGRPVDVGRNQVLTVAVEAVEEATGGRVHRVAGPKGTRRCAFQQQGGKVRPRANDNARLQGRRAHPGRGLREATRSAPSKYIAQKIGN